MEIKMIIKLILTAITLISFIAFWLLQNTDKKYIAVLIELMAVIINVLIY